MNTKYKTQHEEILMCFIWCGLKRQVQNRMVSLYALRYVVADIF